MSELTIPGIDREDIGTLLNVKSYPQYVTMIERILSGSCPFCNLDRELNLVVADFNGWRIWDNPFPTKNLSYHLIVAPVRHIQHTSEMYSSDWITMGAMVGIANRRHALIGGGLIMRWGDPRLNAGSVRHLHVNIMVPDGKGEVRIPLAKNLKDIEHKKVVIAVFEKIRTGTKMSQLSADELKLVAGRM